MKNIRHVVFWPPFLTLVIAVVVSLAASDKFLEAMNLANNWVLESFGWLFSATSFFMLLTCIGIYFSPLGKIRIGGKTAKPILSKWRWFSITLCTTIAIGILFWGTAEPLYHLYGPPPLAKVDANSLSAAKVALSTMYLHWTFTPYAIYAVPTLMFAIAYYNFNEKFSLSAPLRPLLGKHTQGPIAPFIDSICLFSLVAGMAASLGAGILTLSGGLQSLFGIQPSNWTTGMIAITIVGAFAASSISGLMKGIRILSDINIKVFFALAAFVFITGPTAFILNFGVESFGAYLQNFFSTSLNTGAASGSGWSKGWTIFYWANWMAWAPVTALFLGRLTVGYTVKEVLRVNLLLPSLFGIMWMTIFSGTSLHMELVQGLKLHELMQSNGPESVIFSMFKQLPLAGITSLVFIFTSFLSYVTAADSNTEAMGGISTFGICPNSPEPGATIKIVWGLTVGAVAWIMVSFAGIDGIKIMSNLGGLPALFLLLAVTIAAVKFTWSVDHEATLEPLGENEQVVPLTKLV